MNKMRNKLLMTLALLLTAVTGAWAEETLLTTINASSDFISGSKTFEGVATVTITGDIAYDDTPGYGWSAKYSSPGGSVSVEPAEGTTISSCKFYFNNNTYTISTAPFVLYPTTVNGSTFTIYTGPNSTGERLYSYGIKKIEVYGAVEAPLTIDVPPVTGKTNEWTFTMPAFDVEIAPIYAPTAVFATDGNLVLTPTAIEGIYAESTDAIVKAGTVANIGDTENPQGIVMYAVTSTNQATAPDLSAFSADVPTAKDITVGSDVLVWYYIKGADTPEGETASAENTFNDSEICATPITVTVLSNKFDINFKAANDNTIEAKKATVKVGETAAEVTEGKLEGVKMDSKVTVTAKEGYKFRSVEVKKTEAVSYTLISEATTSDYGKVVCAAGHLHDAKTAVPRRCTAVGILGKVTTTGHGLILALSDATSQTWNTINGWTSVTTYASTTLKQLPDDTARGSNLTSYSTLGSTTVSNWCVAQKSDYEAIFTNLGSTTGDSDGTTYDGNVNAYITTGVGGTAITDVYWSATFRQGNICWSFDYISWGNYNKTDSLRVRPVLAF